MNKSKEFIRLTLNTIEENIRRTRDPIGIKNEYWVKWASEKNIARNGNILFYTSRMYQMLPFIMQSTKIVEFLKPFLKQRKLNGFMRFGNRVIGKWLYKINWKEKKEIKKKGEKALKGIIKGLNAIGVNPFYLYNIEPYSGVLIHDLGLNSTKREHTEEVYKIFKENNIKEIITCDPHTTYMLREIYPKIIDDFNTKVKHYLEVLVENKEKITSASKNKDNKKYVIHDSCVMTRDLKIVEEQRIVLDALGIKVYEPENTKLNTDCCGGPIEYGFDKISSKASYERAKELSKISKNIVVFCPICLLNLWKHQKQLGIKVYDMGEIIYEALDT